METIVMIVNKRKTRETEKKNFKALVPKRTTEYGYERDGAREKESLQSSPIIS
jgi:hypothetical protein